MKKEFSLYHAVQRRVFEKALKGIGKKTRRDRGEGYAGVVNAIQKTLGDGWPEAAYDNLRNALKKDGKWTGFFDDLLDHHDPEYLRGVMMAFGFEASFCGFRTTKRISEREGVSIPWVILFDPTSACNLKCRGCWSAEYEHHLNLSYEDMDDLVTQGKQLGIHAYVMTGGEPLVRKKDIVRLAEKHHDCAFLIFTNSTLVDQTFCDGIDHRRKTGRGRIQGGCKSNGTAARERSFIRYEHLLYKSELRNRHERRVSGFSD